MAEHFLATALGCARRALARPADPAADDRLLDRFVRDRDEAAFAELVARHGPVVWAACRRGTPTAADAEDVFQATFLVLARRANRVRRAAAVGGWLFRVAVRLAARTRARAARPVVATRPDIDPAPGPADRATWQDVITVLDEELAGLPDAVRAALVSCYYEGLTQDEAARRLRWKVRTVRARVARGRTLLRERLARRGVELGAALAAVAAVAADAPATAPPLVPARLVEGLPAVAFLVRDGLAMTGGSARLPLAVGMAVVAFAGVGYALGLGSGTAPAGSSLAVAPPAAAPQPPSAPPFDLAAAYDRALDGCVYVVREGPEGLVEGSGALIDKENRLVLTTCRVVGDSEVVSVQFAYHNPDGTIDTDRKSYLKSAAGHLAPRGRVIRRDPNRDLALVQLDRLGRDARALELAETGPGPAVLHVGAGSGPLFPMIGRKVLRGNGRDATVPVASDSEALRPAAPSLSGTSDDSGGPLVDRDGRLVGLVAGVAADPSARNVVALDIATIRAFLADKDTKVSSPPVVVKVPERPIVPEFVPPPFIPPLSGDLKDLYDKTVRSSVFIVTPMKGGMSMGSGSLIDHEKRLVITNAHVVHDAEKVFVQFPVLNKDGSLMTDKKKYIERIPAGQALKGEVLYKDLTRDLALVRLDKLPPHAEAIPLAKKSVRVAEPVINIGNPGLANSVFSATDGVVRAVDVRDFIVGGSDGVMRVKARFVTATNPVSPGDSGGPLIDKRGYQVGVTTSGYFDGRTQNVNAFIDVTEVWAFLAEKKVTIKVLSTEPDKPEIAAKVGPTQPATPPKVDSPGTVTPPVAKDGGTTPPKVDTPAGPTAEEEKKAQEALRQAKLFKEDHQDYFKGKLKGLIRKYPGTAAAAEAQKLLDAMK